MKKRSILIVDPDESQRKLLADLVKSSPFFFVIGDCSNGLEAIRYINALEPELVLMDIDLPGGSGFRVLSESSHLPAVIFTTHSGTHALKAFEHNAIDYLLKPFPRERLEMALEKYLRFDSIDIHSNLLETDSKPALPSRILVESGKRHESISFDDITYFKAEKDYTSIHTIGDKEYLSSFGIGNIERKLDYNRFIRIHRSYIVNIDHIKGSYRDINKLFISLPNGIDISVGRNYLPAIKKMIF